MHLPSLRPKSVIDGFGSMLHSLHDSQHKQKGKAVNPSFVSFALAQGLRRVPEEAEWAMAMDAVKLFAAWCARAGRWSRLIRYFRQLTRSVRVIQRFIRRCCRNHKLLTEAVLVSWRQREEKKLVTEYERVLALKQATVEQPHGGPVPNLPQTAAPIPDRIKRVTVEELWGQRWRRFRAAWRAYSEAFQSAQAASQVEGTVRRKGLSATQLALMAPRPALEFSPAIFSLTYLEKKAVRAEPKELEPFLGDANLPPGEHRRRQPRSWNVPADRRDSNSSTGSCSSNGSVRSRRSVKSRHGTADGDGDSSRTPRRERNKGVRTASPAVHHMNSTFMGSADELNWSPMEDDLEEFHPTTHLHAPVVQESRSAPRLPAIGPGPVTATGAIHGGPSKQPMLQTRSPANARTPTTLLKTSPSGRLI